MSGANDKLFHFSYLLEVRCFTRMCEGKTAIFSLFLLSPPPPPPSLKLRRPKLELRIIVAYQIIYIQLHIKNINC